MWGSFLVAMTLVTGVLAIGDSSLGGGFVGFMAIRPTPIGADDDPLFRTERPLDRDRWAGIVIHHLGQPAGDPEAVRQQHLAYGYRSLGYHFLIGNGRGMGAGDVFAGERWILQQPGAHAVGPDAAWHNERSIAICLVGNGDRRSFDDEQIGSLISLVRRLQRELGIPGERIYLHREVAPGVTSPGRYFPLARLEEQLLR